MNLHEFVLFLYLNSVLLDLIVAFFFGDGFLKNTLSHLVDGFIVVYVVFAIVKEGIKFDVIALCFSFVLLLLLAISIHPELSALALDTLRRVSKCFIGYYLFSRMSDFASLKRLIPYCM